MIQKREQSRQPQRSPNACRFSATRPQKGEHLSTPSCSEVLPLSLIASALRETSRIIKPHSIDYVFLESREHTAALFKASPQLLAPGRFILWKSGWMDKWTNEMNPVPCVGICKMAILHWTSPDHPLHSWPHTVVRESCYTEPFLSNLYPPASFCLLSLHETILPPNCPFQHQQHPHHLGTSLNADC